VQSQFVPHGSPIDLTNCDREPIHAPGTVQPHGALLALDAATERVLAASANAEQFTGESLRQTVNALAADVFGAADADVLRDVAVRMQIGGSAIAARLPASGRLALMHRVDQTVFVEIEAEERVESDLVGATRDAVRGFTDTQDVQVLCDTAATQLRALTGYDRVMVYRFDSDGHGKVVAEARTDALEGYLGRHYPASDIPRQARALYRTTMLRLIVDVDAPAAAIEPLLDPRSGDPWDLGRAILRSSSPIHLQYLRNMGVTATMTVSLLREGELWGLIACHHYTAKFVGYGVRSATETIGHALVSRIVQLEDARIASARSATQDAVIAWMIRTSSDQLATLLADTALHEALGVQGAALVGTGVATSGRTPAPDRLATLAAWLSERAGSELFVTDSLAKVNAGFTDLADSASGLYARRIGAGWLCFFRGEHVQVVDWGGDPAKAVETEGERLSPRGSFALWREEVRHRAQPWDAWTIDALDRLAAWAGKRTTG
jgi:chemotaxis family two-component system sensor kinase Cph1